MREYTVGSDEATSRSICNESVAVRFWMYLENSERPS
jgi:hypothetical protein